MRLGVLPAAGKSERWGGYPKELLPVSDTDTFMSRAVQSLQASGCDMVVVVTNPAKVHLHSYHLRDRENLSFVIQHGEELWGAITTAVKTGADEYLFMMPDTYIPSTPFPEFLTRDFSMGLFATEEPERFGMVVNGQIVDKDTSVDSGLAWGAVAWKHNIVQFWNRNTYANHTLAFNDAINAFGYGEWALRYYFDIGSMDKYADFLSSTTANSDVVDEPSRVKSHSTSSLKGKLDSFNESKAIGIADKQGIR